MNNEPNDLMEYLSEIAVRSEKGEIEWTQLNPATFNWNDPRFHVSIQKAVTPTLRSMMGESGLNASYLFQVTNTSTRQTIVSLSSKERSEFAKVLASIFRGAEKGMDNRAVKVLRELLGGNDT